MVDESKDSEHDEIISSTSSITSSSRPLNGRGKVDLFPALSDRRHAAINAIRQASPQRIGTQITIFNPVSFEEALEIVECLRGRASATISLDNMKKLDANRLVDFVAGASAALDGDFHKLTELVYLFCPSNIKITAPKAASAASKTTSELFGAGALDFLYPDGEPGGPASSSSWAPLH